MITHWVLLSILGSASGYQILNHLFSLRVISTKTLALLRVVLAPIVVTVIKLLAPTLLAGLFHVLILHLSPVLLMILNRDRRRRRFQRDFLPFLDEVLLKMRSGKSLRESILHAGERASDLRSSEISDLSARLCFPEQKKSGPSIKEAEELLNELQRLDQTRARVIERLAFYRKKIRTIQKFRQKSGQVTGQVRAQALICGFLYLFLIFWTGLTDSKALQSPTFLISAFLFFLGIILMLLISRSFKWRI